MGWFFGDKDAVEDYKAAREDLHEYGQHQRERGRLDEDETPEYYRLSDRVAEAAQRVPWWRR